ncbi:MAG: hypothetical protein QXP42_00465 [Candidatus Micrarchaeia archaeon]
MREEYRLGETTRTKRLSLPAGIKVQEISWQTLIDMFLTELYLDTEELEKVGQRKEDRLSEIRKLKKELAMVRHTLEIKIRDSASRNEFDTRFFIDLVKLLKKCERLAEMYEIDMEHWQSFLSVVIEKLKHEKMIIYGKVEHPDRRRERMRMRDLEKMKDIV